MLDGALEQEPEAVHERVEVAAHVVAAEEQGEEALDNGVEELKFDVASYADEEKWRDNLVEALAVRHAAALAVPVTRDGRRAVCHRGAQGIFSSISHEEGVSCRMGRGVQSKKRGCLVTCLLVRKRRLICSGALQVNLYDRVVFQIEGYVAVKKSVIVTAPDVEKNL